MLKTVTPGEALSILYSAFGARRTEAEACPLALARGRVLAEDVEAAEFVPGFDRSSVDGYALAGGFLFLGILLGLIFLLATVLLIYYKQISEGYEDQGRFEIMRKVGLSRRQVKQSIRSQILMVFFLPIAVAAVHILFDFNMVVKLLELFGLRNVPLTALCTLGTVLVFFLAYGAVYLMTARTYYKIVSSAR